MPARWYIARVLGTGAEADAYRVAAADFPNQRLSATIPSNPDGTPMWPWGLVRVDATDFAAIDASPDCVLVWDDDREAPVSTIPNAQRNRIITAAARFGLTLRAGQGPMVPTNRLRVLLRALGQALEPTFNEDAHG